MRTYGRTTCAYCTNDDGGDFWFTREVPNQKYCCDAHRQLHEQELAGGPVHPISKNYKRLSDYPEFRALSISKAESDEEKHIKKVRSANKAEARKNTHFDQAVNHSVLYGFDGKAIRYYDNAEEKKHQIIKCSFRKKFIYEAILELIS